jgi:hypothetical protein
MQHVGFLKVPAILGVTFLWPYLACAQTTAPESSNSPVIPSVNEPGGTTAAVPNADDAVLVESKPSAATNSEIEQVYKEEREKFLNTLKKEIEPNLIKGDIQKLNRNVMRLGSYRKDWVVASEEFLLANAALAEPYLYRYSMIGNQRLNRAILKTLLHFPSLREPRAALMFLHVFVDDPEQTASAMDLLSKVIEQNPQLAAESTTFLNGPISQKIPLDKRLQFGAKACSKVASTATAAKEALKSWQAKSSQFWEKVLSDELDSCLKSV